MSSRIQFWATIALIMCVCRTNFALGSEPESASEKASLIVIDVRVLSVELPRSIDSSIRAVTPKTTDDEVPRLDYASIENVDEFVNRLKEIATVKTISAPKLLVQDGQAAELHVGEQLGFRAQTISEAGTTAAVEFLSVGTQLRVVATSSTERQLHVEIHLEVSKATLDEQTGLPRKSGTSIETSVVVNHGESKVIGGMLEERADGHRRELIAIVTPSLSSSATGSQKSMDVRAPRTTKRPDKIAGNSPPSDDSQMRFDGKTFGEWRAQLVTELNPKHRLEALQAVSAFGANGHAIEATEAIITILNGYQLNTLQNEDLSEYLYTEHEHKLLGRAQLALVRIGPDAAPVLIDAINRRHRQTYARYAALGALAQEHVLAKLPDESITALVKIVQDEGESATMRQSVIELLHSMGPKAKSATPVLQQLTKDKQSKLYDAAARALETINR